MTKTPQPNKHGVWPDIMAQKASDYFKVPLSQVTPEMREKMKIITHADNYSAGMTYGKTRPVRPLPH